MPKIRKLDEDDFDALIVLQQDAFSGFPWFEHLTVEEVQARLNKHMGLPGFSGIVFERDEQVVGAEWWDEISTERLELERGKRLRDWCESRCPNVIIWERELIVARQFQRQGIGTKLRGRFLQQLKEKYGQALVLTRLREDNIGTLRSALFYGYEKTGITVPASQKPWNHEYWFKQV